ncbi:hypothetical protein P9112_007618 [Eukaryota sp. TZLM1-RC]
MFDPWLSRIRSEQRQAIAAQEHSFNNCSVNHLDLYVNESGRIVIPSSLINDTLLIIHGYVSGGHPSMFESLRRLSFSDYYWPSMTDDMKNHVRSCPSCQKTAPVPKTNTPSTGSLWADKPFARLNVDTIGPLPSDQEANKYILVFVDSFTGYTILVPLKESNARLTADALIWSVRAIFGIPYSIHSDNGPEFATNVFKSLCEFLSIDVTNGVESKASISQCKLYHSDKPTDDKFHRIVASGDTEEHLLSKVLNQDGNECQVVYAGDVRGTEPVDRIKNTKADQAFLQTNKSRPSAGQPTRKQPHRRARRDSRKASLSWPVYDGIEIEATLCSTDANCPVGSFVGNIDEVTIELIL